MKLPTCLFLRNRARRGADGIVHTAHHPGRRSGFTIIEGAVSAGLLALVAASTTQALLQLNRSASSAKVLTAARTIVHRNIETAMGVPFNKAVTPAILASTPNAGEVWDDDGGGDNQVNIITNRAGTNTVIKGTLTRIVTAEANPPNADIRRVTFRVNFTCQKRAQVYSETSVRSAD